MKSLSKFVIVTSLISATAFTGLHGTAFTQPVSDNAERVQGVERENKGDYRHRGSRQGVGFFHVMCREVDEERINRFFEQAGTRLDITADQQSVFNDLKSAVTNAQRSFSAKCQATRQDRSENAVERLQTRQTMLEARLEANKQILPAFEAFYVKLNDAQKQTIDAMGQHGGKGKNSKDQRGGKGKNSKNSKDRRG